MAKSGDAYKPLSPWAYFGLQILFTIPVIGFVFLIIFSISKGNIHRRNFARSYWCGLILIVALFGILFLISALSGGSIVFKEILDSIKNVF